MLIFATTAEPTLMNLQDWIGKSETLDDVATATPYAALAALLTEKLLRLSRRREGVQ